MRKVNSQIQGDTGISWKQKHLGDVCRVVGGGTPLRAQPKYWDGDIPWATVKDFTDDSFVLSDTEEHVTREGLESSASTLVPENTPIVCTRMAVGRCALTTRPTAINQDLKALLLDEDFDRRFFIRLLRQSGPTLDRVSIGSTVRGITLRDLLALPLRYPKQKEEQTRIAAVLDTVDEAIAKTQAVIAKLKQVRAGLLHDLLTRGIDEHGQFRDPDAHPEQFQDSPLGRIPKAWEVTRLGSCSELVTSGSRGWASYYSKSGPLFLRISNLTREHINLRFDDVVRVQPPLGSEGARTMVRGGDMLISITADLGIVGVVPESLEEAYVNQHIALVRPGSQLISRWIGRFLGFGPGANQFRSLNDSGAKAGLNLPAVASLMIAMPSPEEQVAASTVLDKIDEGIEAQLRFGDKLVHINSGLMNDLLTGRVRVPEGIAEMG